jgi:ankyrin repeat protein
MPITFEQFNIFLAAEMDHAREIAKTFTTEINLPIPIGRYFGRTPLIELCIVKETTHKAEKLKLLLEHGADANIVEKYHGSPLMQALENDLGPEFIKTLLDAKADVNLPDNDGKTAIFVAVKYRRFDDLRTLQSRGANLNHRANNGDTALTEEIKRKESSLDVVKLLIQLGADINAAKALLAAFRGRGRPLDMVPTLIEFGADVNAKDDDGASPLALAASIPVCPVSTIAMLVKAGAVIDSVDAEGRTPLLYASKSGHTDAVKLLLECKASATHCDVEGKSALHWCSKAGNAAIIPLLVNAGADINLPDKADEYDGENNGGRTPLMYAVSREDTTKALLKFNPDINIVDKKKRSALMHALAGYSSQKSTVVEMLLQKGLRVDLADVEGNTALHLIANLNHSTNAEVKLLLDAKADPNSVNVLGRTPLMICQNTKSMELLIKGGANIDAIDKVGKTALIHGVSTYSYRSDAHLRVKILLSAKAHLDIKDHEGKTALMYAVRNDDYIKSVRLLVDSGADLELLDKEEQPATAHATPDNLMLLITAGAKPSTFEDHKLLNAVYDDNLPLISILLERGAKMKLKLDHFVRFKRIFEKLARANSDLLRSGVVCTDPEAQEQFDVLLAKFPKNEDIADDADLPQILKKGAWPIKISTRKPLILPAGRIGEIDKLIDYCVGAIQWPDDLKESVLREFKKHSAEKNTKTPDADSEPQQDYFSGFLTKKGSINFATLFKNWTRESDAAFIEFWNANAVAIKEKVVIEASWRNPPMGVDEIIYLLARFDLAVLPGILKTQKKSTDFVDALRFVDAPACAGLMSRAMVSGPSTRIARQWALKFPESCTKGLIIDAISKVGKDRTAAEATMRFLASNGHKQVVESVAAQFGADVVESIAETLTQDHRADFMPPKPPKMPKFWSADVYPQPRLKSNNKVLPAYAIDAIASMLSISNSEVRVPTLDSVIEACDPKSLASFAWGAFEEWAEKGKKDSEWIFDSLTYLGDDTCARKLTPYIRNWPRENGIARARKGLEILAAIGTDVALSQIQAISQKNKYQSVLDSAQEMMKKIAVARDLKPQQLEDRLVPDLGLSEKGDIKLNFGPRYFIGSVDAQLKPVIKDANGAGVKTLPAAAKEDDKALAKESAAVWSDLCKELRPVAKLQLERLELAMVNSRRWTGADFKTLFVASPMLQNLVKGLVWGIFPSKTKLSASFMVNAENAFVDAEGKSVNLTDGSTVGILHPLLMDNPSLAAWQKLFAKNKQIQPFAQLVRKTYRAIDDTENNRFGLDGATVASKALKGLLAMGWSTDIGDAGWIWSFERKFSSGNASLGADPGVHITDYEMNAKEQKLDVSIPDTLNPIEFSEIIRELMTLKK